MTTILPPQELAVLRSMAKSAAVLFAWMSIERLYPGRPVSEYTFADLLIVDVRTVQRQLRNLSCVGLVTGQGNGNWVLTPNGRHTLFARSAAQNVLESMQVLGPPQKAQRLEGTEVIEANPNKFAAQNVRSSVQVLHPSHVTQSIEETEVIEAGSDKFVAQNVPLEEEDLRDSDFNKSSSSLKSTFCAETEEILKYTYLLFDGGSVNINDVTKNRDPMTAIAWISKAYADRKNLRMPQGLVFQRLMSGEQPPVYLRKDPFKGLPGEYLEAIGYQAASEPDEDCEADVEEIVEAEVVSESLNHEPAAIAWRAVQVQLQGTMPRNNFDAYVRESNGVAMGDGWLTVRAKCAEDCEWLESRLESSVNRMLVGICGSAVRVRFVSTGGE